VECHRRQDRQAGDQPAFPMTTEFTTDAVATTLGWTSVQGGSVANQYKIALDELLLRVAQYDLYRTKDESRIPIYVGEVIARDAKAKFVAEPRLLRSSDERFFGYGDSRDTALRDCLAKISGVSARDIFPDQLK
jgi:hypothetical protein